MTQNFVTIVQWACRYRELYSCVLRTSCRYCIASEVMHNDF